MLSLINIEMLTVQCTTKTFIPVVFCIVVFVRVFFHCFHSFQDYIFYLLYIMYVTMCDGMVVGRWIRSHVQRIRSIVYSFQSSPQQRLQVQGELWCCQYQACTHVAKPEIISWWYCLRWPQFQRVHWSRVPVYQLFPIWAVAYFWLGWVLGQLEYPGRAKSL